MAKIHSPMLKNILEKFESDSPYERMTAIAELSNVPKDQFNDDLKIELLFSMNEIDDDLRIQAEKLARKLGYVSQQQIFEDLTNEGKEKLYAKLEEYGKNEYWTKRKTAIAIISSINLFTEKLPLLLEVAVDNEWEVNDAAQQAIQQLGEQIRSGRVVLKGELRSAVINILKDYAKSTQWINNYVAATAIGALGLVECVDDLIYLVPNKDKFIRDKAVASLHRIEEEVKSGKTIPEPTLKRVSEMIKTFLKNDDWKNEYAVVHALSVIPKEEFKKRDIFKVALLLLMRSFLYDKIRDKAFEIAHKLGYSSIEDIYEELSDTGKDLLDEMITAYCSCRDRDKGRTAITVVTTLSLIHHADLLTDYFFDDCVYVQGTVREYIRNVNTRIKSGKLVLEEDVKKKMIQTLNDLLKFRTFDTDYTAMCVADAFNLLECLNLSALIRLSASRYKCIKQVARKALLRKGLNLFKINRINKSSTSPPDNAFRNKGRKREEIKEKRKRL